MPIIRVQIKPIGYLSMTSPTSSQVKIFIILAGQAKPSSMPKQISIINMEVVATGAVSAVVAVKDMDIGVVTTEGAIDVVDPEDIESAEMEENIT